MVRIFKVDAKIRYVFPTCGCGAALPHIRRLRTSENWMVSKDAEGFSRRALALCVPSFSAASHVNPEP